MSPMVRRILGAVAFAAVLLSARAAPVISQQSTSEEDRASEPSEQEETEEGATSNLRELNT